MLAWSNLFGATTYLLSQKENYRITINDLMNTILTTESGTKERRIQSIARSVKENIAENLSENDQQDLLSAVSQIETFFRQDGENVATIDAMIINALSPFQRSKYLCFSDKISVGYAKTRPNFYDQIIDEGKIVLVSMSPGEPAMSKTVCTLVKCLFQRSVLSRLERVRRKKLKNFKRPLILACDEYAQVASELPGQNMGDGDFFSQSRQNGCMGLLVTQSVNVLQATSLKESWKSIFSNFGAKIFLRLADNETAEEAVKLAGEYDWYISSEGMSRSKDGLSTSSQKEMRERKTLPSYILTQIFEKGDAVILGSLNGSSGESNVRFVHVKKGFKPGDTEVSGNAGSH
jgi:type IV secretory pathway TraG/TraD family ATPase VirD4